MAKRIKPVFGRIQNVGGHMINPPDECSYRKKFPDSIWVDLTCCFVVCKNHCEKYEWYARATRRMRIRYLQRNGVYYPWNY